MKTYKNKNWKRRDYECTNVVACVAAAAPDDNWIECDASELERLTPLWIERCVQYYGFM